VSDLSSRLAQLSPEQRARLAARMQTARAAESNSIPDDAIAIIGMSCRYPGGANSPDAFWELLRNGVDAVTTVPADRWDGDAFFDADVDAPGKIAAREGAFVSGVADFDPEYFGISPFEARQMDPQQRLFLEVSLEALESAGLTRAQLAGSACAVYVGVHSHSSDYYGMQVAQLESVDTYTSTGTAHSVLANRLSYFLDLRGPSMAIDTACSSSLVALHQACMSLRARESTVAIAAGVNLMLSPEASVAFSKLRVLSPGARCRTFDAAADGMARGEGCGVVVLKRVSDAIRDGDPLLAIIRGTAVNQDGATNGLTAPSTPSQVAVIRAALAVAQLDVSRVSYVETHGTGTALGDPIEVDAIAETYGAPRSAGDSVVLGALKTNIGHLEGAAGIAGVIKTVLCLRRREIPKNLHFVTRNPLVRLEGTSIELATEARAWNAVNGSRIGAVSSFGFGGTNAHAILEEVPADLAGVHRTLGAADAEGAATPELLPLLLSGHTADALTATVDRWRDALRGALSTAAPSDVSYTAALRRSHHAHRVAVTGATTSAWADRLDARARVTDNDALPPLMVGERRKVAFAFCGQGPQWFAMGRELAAREPVFRDAIADVAACVQRIAGWDLLAELARDEATSRIHATEVTQPAIFAIQMALVALWRARGVTPDFVIGHSMGEIAAACTAGAIDLEEGARIAVFRGKAVSQAEGLGSMIAMPISRDDALQAIAGREDRVGIAAVNAPQSVVLAGDEESLGAVTSALRLRGIEGRALEVRYASHSPQMEPLVGWLRDALGVVTHCVPSVPMFSSISHSLVESAMLDAAHWGVGLRRSVDFAGGVRAALDAGCRAFVDIAPHPVMAGYVRECADEAGVDVVAVPSLRRNVGESEQMLQSLCELYESGVSPQWDAVLGARARVVPLPAYPWQHARYWIAAAPRTPVGAVATSTVAMSVAKVSAVDVMHELRWTEVPTIAAVRDAQTRKRFIVGGSVELRAALSARCERDGIVCHCFDADNIGGGDIGADTIAAVIDVAAAAGGDIIDLRALTRPSSVTLSAGAATSAMSLRQLLSALSTRTDSDARDAAGASGVRVWSVTRGAQSAHASEQPNAAQAAAWGIGRVAAVEMPTLWGGMVDLDPAAHVNQDADDLWHALTQHTAEYESVYRAGRRHVPRLQSMPAVPNAFSAAGDGYFIVTGGLGGVGLVVAEWLAERGAKRIALLGRTPLTSRERWDDDSLTADERRRIDAVRATERHGATVCTASIDVADTGALQRFAAERRSEGWGSARGILHCAVAMQFALLTERNDTVMDAMMRSKIGGAEALLSAFGSDQPEFIVMFSSLAVLLGDRGQGAYAAANAALDAWTLVQRRAGTRVSVINWGAWLNTGLAASRGGELVTDTLKLRGVLPVSRQAATAALGAVIAGNVASAAVFGVGAAESMAPVPDAWRVLDGLQRGTTNTIPAAMSARDELLLLSGAKARLARLTDLVREVIATMLGLDDTRIDVNHPLGPLGMDSLLAIRIRRRCERLFDITLPATALFSYPTVASFSGMLFERLDMPDRTVSVAASSGVAASDAAVERVPVPATLAAGADSVGALSDDDALAALRTRRPSPRGAA
jgi:myxalamid-type polyketide synthase MxaC